MPLWQKKTQKSWLKLQRKSRRRNRKRASFPCCSSSLWRSRPEEFGAWFFAIRPSKTSKAKPKAAAVPEEPKIKSVLHIESFVVNLADQTDTAFLRVGVDIGLDKEMKKEEADKQPQIMPRVRDTLLDVLTSYQSPELLAVDGKAKLRGRLLQALQARVPEVGVREIYFTDFLVQR